MPNANTVLAIYGATATAATTNFQPFYNTNVSTTIPISLSIPANWNFNARPFNIRMAGTITNLNSTTVVFTPAISVGVSSTAASNVTMCSTSTGLSTNLAAQLTANFVLDIECMWDSVTNTINGVYQLFAGPTGARVAPTAMTSVTSLTQGNAGTTGLNFIPFFAFGTSSTNQAVVLTEFSITQD